MSDAPIIFLNGELLPATAARLNVYDTGIILGATVSEMARTFRRRLFRLEKHLRRLEQSLRAVRFDVGMPSDEMAHVAERVVEHNARLAGEDGELGLVVFVTAGENPMYAPGPAASVRTGPTVCIQTFPLRFGLWAERMRDGAHLVTPAVRQLPPACVPPTIKHRSRIHYYLAEREAAATEPGAIPLLLDLDGHVTETSTANLLIVEGETIVSPRPTSILPGISREVVVELTAELGLAFVEDDLDVARVTRADEAVLASTPYCLMPAVRINGAAIGSGQPGPVFRRLIDAWSRHVGLDIYRQIAETPPPRGT